MKIILALVRRNTKVFFKDKVMFFSSLITPIILLVLYGTFLASLYRMSVEAAFPPGFGLPDSILDGFVGGQLVSSILAVSCVTVAFSSNFLMVQDKVVGSIHDLKIAPIKNSQLALSYYLSSLLATMIVCLSAMAIFLVYLAIVGWYLSFVDVLLLIFDVFLLVFFGTALSSIINTFLSTQGQISAVATIISAGYGFICGAYMPISTFGSGLQKVLMFLPGTYGTSLLRFHALRGVFKQMALEQAPAEAIIGLQNGVDYNVYFFDQQVSVHAMYLILIGSIVLFLAIYILINKLRKR